MLLAVLQPEECPAYGGRLEQGREAAIRRIAQAHATIEELAKTVRVTIDNREAWNGRPDAVAEVFLADRRIARIEGNTRYSQGADSGYYTIADLRCVDPTSSAQGEKEAIFNPPGRQ